MKRTIFYLVLSTMAILTGCSGRCGDPLEYVDTTIGGVGVLLQPTRPTVQIPNQLIRWSPLRADLLDDCISDYPLTLTSHRLSSVFGFLPIPADHSGDIWSLRQEYDHEQNTPYLYSAQLDGCTIEFTTASKSAIVKVEFDSPDGRGILRFRSLCGDGRFTLKDSRTLEGYERFNGLCAYIHAVFDKDMSVHSATAGERDIALFTKTQGSPVQMRYAISYISCESAASSLEREIPQFRFDDVRAAARDSWTKALGRIKVTGGTEAQKRLFYSSLYRCCERMVDITEDGRYFSAFDGKVHETDRTFYTDNWMWDTHISLEPLCTILDPDKEEDKLQSYVEMYKQCGSMPSFAVIFGDWPAMTGNYAAVWMADSRAKGLRFDVATAYEGLRKNSLDATLIPWRNGPRTAIDDFYNENGYYPALHPGEAETIPQVDTRWERRQAVSITTAFSYADWATAQLARELGKKDDEALFLRRAAFYRNVYRPDKHMFWPKDKDGNWIEGVDPRYMDRAYYTENNAYTFMWDVKHDLSGLFDLMGGRAEAEKNLDAMFRTFISMPKYMFFGILPDATGMVGQFAMGNEPSFHIPYIYNYLGSPWKTQKRIHSLIDNLFSDTVQGLPGDEDGGGMSSFVVFSMMGFFPVTPGIPVYAIGSPFFEKSEIALPDGATFTVKARNYGPENKYIQSARLNGKRLERAWFTHRELMAGGTLELTMGPKPNKQWGAAVPPPSTMDFDINKSDE